MSPATRLVPLLPEPIANAPSAPATFAPNRHDPRSRAARRRRWIRRLLVLGLLAAAAAALRVTLLAPTPVRVRTARVTRGAVEETVTNTRAGTVRTRRHAHLSPETGGRVVELPRRKGARVASGDLLLRLDSSVQQAQLDLTREDVRAVRARVDEACLAAGLAEKELRRTLELKAGGIASPQMLERAESERDRARATCRAAGAQLDQAEARRRLAEAERAHTELRVPFAGVVAEVNTELGEWITPAPPGIPIPPVVEILDPSSIYVSAPIDEMDAERVRPGQAVRLSVDSRRGEHFPGRLVRVAPYVQDLVQQNRTIEVEAELEDRTVAATLLPGTSADVEIILSRREDVLQVPSAAIGQGATVLVVEGRRLAERPIRAGLRNWRTTEVLEGLANGDQVVVARDSPEIKAGARVVAEAGP